MNDILQHVGSSLVEYAENAEFTGQRGLIDELFPYIYLASQRMSLRAISRWLAADQGIKLSDVAISRAMRNAEKHWEAMVDAIEPSARRFADAHNVEPAQILKDETLFEHLETQPPIIGEDVDVEYEAYLDAAQVLRNRWFSYPEAVQKQCWRHFGVLQQDSEVVEVKKHARKSTTKK